MGLGEEARVTPSYFSSIGDCLAELMIGDVLTASTLPSLTNMVIGDIQEFGFLSYP